MRTAALLVVCAVTPALGIPQSIGWNDWICNCYVPGTRESEAGDLCKQATGFIQVSKGIVQCLISVIAIAGLPNPGMEVFTDANCKANFGNGFRGQCADKWTFPTP